jgi:uncharacterized protein YbaR (Trm112 family)
MVSDELLQRLRCPLDPTHEARLAVADHHLTCERCRLAFPVKDGIPNLVVEEAELPPGCASLQALPCQQG